MTAVADADGAGSSSDFGLATGGSAWEVTRRFEALAGATGMHSPVIGRQVHGSRIVGVDSTPGPGVFVVGDADGLMTSAEGVLLAVTAADCVPAYLADLEGRCVALVHAGWRGAAAGIIERAEVLTALGKPEDGPSRIDLRSELADRAVGAGVAPERVSRSDWCTKCGPVRLHSHRAQGSNSGRMAAFLGLLPAPGRRPGADWARQELR
jgi:copper oxidase (laccase) domain-containing protein